MSTYGTKLAEGFSNKLMKRVYDRSLLPEVTNRDYEGEINAVGSKLNILDFDAISEKTYANVALTADDLTENNGQLIIDQYKSFFWKEKVLAKWLSYIKNPHATIVKQVADERLKNMDTFVFSKYSDVGAGNMIGTSVTTGTVTVDATTGLVTGSGTTFTSTMVGRSFKALGHTRWYRVKTFTNTTSMVIEDDKDDVDSAYTGGAIAGGATFEVQAVTPITLTVSNLLATIGQAKLILDRQEAEGNISVPDDGRVLVLPPVIIDLIPRATGIALHVPAVYEDLIKKGMVTMLQGFKIFSSNRLSGDNTNGYRCLALHPQWMTFADKVLQARMQEDLDGDFGTAYKDLFVYGAKVKDLRRNSAVEIFAKV